MNAETPRPRRIEWSGPENWTVWADEDGCHIRAAGGSALEQGDVERLFALWTQAKESHGRGHVPAPRPPTREQMREETRRRGDAYTAKRVIRAVKNELTPTDTPPF